jgi:hypothetical protein
VQTHCVSAADGSFRMEHVPPGEVDVVAIAWGHLPAIGARIVCVDGRSRPRATSCCRADRWSPAAWSTARASRSRRAALLEPRRLEELPVRFQLRADDGPGVKGFELPKTGPDGSFHAGPIAGEAPWKVDFQKLGFADATLAFDPQKDGEPAASNVTVVMQRGGALEGIVMDELAAEPVPSFTISTSERIDTEEDAPGGRNPFSGGITFEDAGGRFRSIRSSPARCG